MSNNNVLLSIRGVQKCFSGLQTLSDVSPEIHEGEIYGLIGPNGAGKTTFLNVITGLYTPDTGGSVPGGTPYQPIVVHEVAKAGVACTFQNTCLLGDMTAAENVMVGHHVRIKVDLIDAVLRTKAVREEEQSIEDWVHDLLDYVGIGKYTNYTVRNLSYGHQRHLEIACALATQPKLLALDKSAAGMNATEKVELRGLLDKIRSDDKTILLVEHDVKLVMGLCNRLTALDYGKATVQGLPHEAQSNPVMIEAYLGVSAH